MVQYKILDERSSDYMHRIVRLGIMSGMAFIQELNYFKPDKTLQQHTIRMSLEAGKRMMEAN